MQADTFIDFTAETTSKNFEINYVHVGKFDFGEKSAVALTPPKGHQTSCKGAHGSLRVVLD